MELAGRYAGIHEWDQRLDLSGKPYFTAPEKVVIISFKKILHRPATVIRKTDKIHHLLIYSRDKDCLMLANWCINSQPEEKIKKVQKNSPRCGPLARFKIEESHRLEN